MSDECKLCNGKCEEVECTFCKKLFCIQFVSWCGTRSWDDADEYECEPCRIVYIDAFYSVTAGQRAWNN